MLYVLIKIFYIIDFLFWYFFLYARKSLFRPSLTLVPHDPLRAVARTLPMVASHKKQNGNKWLSIRGFLFDLSGLRLLPLCLGGVFVVEHDQEEFVSRRLKKQLKDNKIRVVIDLDVFTAGVLGSKIAVSGKEVRAFVQAYESKLGEYLNKPFLRLLTDGVLTPNLHLFRAYVLGAAICQHYGFPEKRFIEVQFYYHDAWKSRPPTLSYITSLNSEWSSVGRYRQYCDEFKDELDYFDEGKDNVNKAYKGATQRGHSQSPTPSLIRIYENMVTFQMDAKGCSRKEALKVLGRPGKNHVPVKYLRTLPLYLELVSEDAWGKEAYKFDFYKTLKAEIENMINGR